MPYAENNGVKIHYEVEGNGPPLVLQHGGSRSLKSLYANGYVEALKGDYRLIMIDARGHGDSDKPHDAGAYDQKLMASDVIAVLDAENIAKSHYMGYSMGGSIGFAIAESFPERVHSIIIGGMHPYPMSTMVDSVLESLKNGMEAYVAAMEKNVPLPPESKEQLLANDHQAIMGMCLGLKNRPDWSRVLPTMTMPCLLFAGEADEFFEGSKDAASRIPNSTFFSMPGLNHTEANQRSDLVLPHVTKFLASVSEKVVAAD